MAPTRAMTGDTVVGDVEKGPQSPTDTECTLGGDAIIEIAEDENENASTRRPSSDSGSGSIASEASAQPRTLPFFRTSTFSLQVHFP